MRRKTKDYLLLLAAVLLFYVIITFDVNTITNAGRVEYIKLGTAFLAALYLLVYNIKRFRSAKDNTGEESKKAYNR